VKKLHKQRTLSQPPRTATVNSRWSSLSVLKQWTYPCHVCTPTS